MKILIPVDFSAASKQALNYGRFISAKTDAEIILLHVFDIPVMTADAYVFIPPEEEIQKIRENNMIHLKHFATDDFHESDQNPKMRYECAYGYPTEIINEFALQEKADLIIMGIHGKCVQPGYFMGSTFIHCMNHSRIPVIGLHGSSQFTAVSDILFAYDLKEFENKSILEPLIHFATSFDAHIHVLHVCEEIDEFPMLNETLRNNHLSPAIPESKISFHIIQNKNIAEGIKEFIKTQHIDLICFIPREHNFFYKLFRKSTTRSASFQLDLPIMSIHN